MKSHKILFYMVFILLLASATASAYTPQGEGFVESLVFAHAPNNSNVIVGDHVDMTTVVKNLTNDTVSNITITQSYSGQLLKVGNQKIDGAINLTDFSLTDSLSNQQLTFSYFNITETNFTANLQINLLSDQQIAFGFVMNFTAPGTFTFIAPTVVYYDHWPDQHTASKLQNTVVIVNDKAVDSRRQYIPTFDTVQPNYYEIFGYLFGVVLLALLSRFAYGKIPPFRM